MLNSVAWHGTSPGSRAVKKPDVAWQFQPAPIGCSSPNTSRYSIVRPVELGVLGAIQGCGSTRSSLAGRALPVAGTDELPWGNSRRRLQLRRGQLSGHGPSPAGEDRAQTRGSCDAWLRPARNGRQHSAGSRRDNGFLPTDRSYRVLPSAGASQVDRVKLQMSVAICSRFEVSNRWGR